MSPALLRSALIVLGAAALGARRGAVGQCTSGTCPPTSTGRRGAIYGRVHDLVWAPGARTS